MKFTYTKITYNDGNEEYGEDFEYEPSDGAVENALIQIIKTLYFGSLKDFTAEQHKEIDKGLKSLINSEDDLWERFKEVYYNELKDYFKNEALQLCKN